MGSNVRAGSSPAPGTKRNILYVRFFFMFDISGTPFFRYETDDKCSHGDGNAKKSVFARISNSWPVYF